MKGDDYRYKQDKKGTIQAGVISAIAFCLICGIFFYIYRLYNPSAKVEFVSKKDFQSGKAFVPILSQAYSFESQRIKLNPVFRTDLLGNIVIEGSLENTNSKTYKDVVFSVTYISKTGSEIATKKYTIYEYATPHVPTKFKIKEYDKSLKDADNLRYEVLSARTVN